MSFNFSRRNLFGMGVLGGAATLAGTSTLISPTPARAQGSSGDKLQQVLARGHLVVGTGSDLPPFYFTNENGDFDGLEIDLARLLARGLFNDERKVEFVVQTSDSRIPNLLSNRVDITIQNLTVTAPRAQQIEFSITYYRTGQGLLMRKSGPYKSFDELKGAGARATISALQNVFIADWVHEILPDAKVVQYPTPDAALQSLNAAQADAQYIDHSQIDYMLAKMPDRYIDSGFTHKAGSLACGIAPGQFRFLNFVNTALREAMIGVDYTRYAGMLKKWLGVTVPTPKIGYPHELIS